MIAIRSTIFFLLMSLGMIIFGLLVVISSPVLSRRGMVRLVSAWGRYNSVMLALSCGLRQRIIGRENLPEVPYLIMAKHQSAWETLVFNGIFDSLAWVMKKSLIYIPFFGWALWASRQIFIDRSQGVQAMKMLQREGRARLQAGDNIIIFPEGTRIPMGQVGNYKPGGVGIALAAGAPIVPVALDSGRLWEPKTFMIRPGTVEVRIGKPIETAGRARRDRNALLEEVKVAIEGMMQEMDQRGG